MPGAIDRVRAMASDRRLDEVLPPPGPETWAPGSRVARTKSPPATVLAATDPANPYGAALAWPERVTEDGAATGHRPGRKAGALVVLVDGELVLYVERGGRSLLTWSDDPARLQPAVDALALAVRDGSLGRLAVERTDGDFVLGTPLGSALEAAGFRPHPRGLRLRG
jgi:ATP-dependent Lhr-like helicase